MVREVEVKMESEQSHMDNYNKSTTTDEIKKQLNKR